MVIGTYNKTVLITYIGICLSIVGMVVALNGNSQLGLVCFIFAGICDLFDGKFANLFKRNDYQKDFGVEIDSLGDMINFVAFPIILSYSMGLRAWWQLVVYIIYALAAITRLAHFNVMAKSGSSAAKTHFQGLPVTYSALLFPTIWLLLQLVLSSYFSLVYSGLFLVIALLFIVNIKIPKPGKKSYLFFGILSLVVSYLILTWR